jgi:diguanylate cyclase (GGDEF)-like protein
MELDARLIFFLLRMGFGLAGLYFIGRLIATSSAYRSWRTYAFFGLALICFALILAFRLSAALGLDLSTTYIPQITDVLFVLGVVGVLYEAVVSDQRRLHDSHRLIDQWRRASGLAEQRLHELEILAAINRKLAASLELRDVLQSVVDQALELGDADGVAIFVRDPDTGVLADYRVTASASERFRTLPTPRSTGVTAEVARSGEAAFITNAQRHPLFANGAYPELNAIASLPLLLKGQVVGVLNVGYARPYQFEDSAIRMLKALADAAALAVHNAELHERIRKQAVTDELTGLVNRRRFLESLRAEILRARRYGHPMALLMVDLDRLKQINDHYGHAGGDAMLRGVAQCMRLAVRVTDVPARLGGDEFAVLMPETKREAALAVAERIRASVEEFRAQVDGVEISSTVSIGLISREAGYLQDLPSFIHMADEALYKSKTSGRNTITAWDVPAPPLASAIDAPADSG